MSAQDCEAQDGGWGLLGELPGDPMIWVLIFSELAVFGLLLGAFVIARAINPSVFASGQAALDPGLAAGLTCGRPCAGLSSRDRSPTDSKRKYRY